jgi:hypothetical protein
MTALIVRSPVVATAAVFLGFVAIVWLSLLAPGGAIDLFEAGNWLGPASDMLAGKLPYRETYPVHGFLADGGVDYLLFRFFGADLSVSLAFRRLLSALFHPLLFLLTAAATRRPLVAIAAIPILVGFSIATAFDRPVVPLLSLFLFVLALDEKPRRFAFFMAGATGAIGLLYALDFGTFVLAAELATLAVAAFLVRRRSTADFAVSYFGGLAIVLLPWCAYLASVGALGQFFRVSFVELPRYVHSIWGIDFPKPWEIVPLWLRGDKFFVAGVGIGPAIGKRLYLAPLMGLLGLVVAALAARRRTPPDSVLRLVVLSIASILFFRHVIARYHIAVGNALSGPVFVAILVAVHSSWPAKNVRGKRIRAWALVLVGAAAAVGMAGPRRLLEIVRSAAAYPSRIRMREGLARLDLPRGGRALFPKAQVAEIETLADFANAHSKSGDYVLDLSNRPALYFFLERRNPTRFYQAPMMAPYEDEAIRDLQTTPPTFVILTSGTYLDAIDGRPNSKRIPAVWDHVLRHYPVTASVAGSTIALPMSSSASGAVLPEDNLQQGPKGARPHSDSLTLR